MNDLLDEGKGLEFIRQLYEKSTPGVWDYIGDTIVGVVAGCHCGPAGIDTPEGVFITADSLHGKHNIICAMSPYDVAEIHSFPSWEQYIDDCKFIAEAHNRIP